MGTQRNRDRGPHDLIRADWYARTVDLMSDQTIDANYRTLCAQLAEGFVWDTGYPPTSAEMRDIGRCIVILNAEIERRRHR